MKKINLSKIKHTFAGGGAILTNQKHVLITILVFIELLLITCAYVSYGNKNLDKYIFGKSETAKSSSFAFMLENDNGDYVLSKDNTFPGDDYTYNQVKSGCMDADGEMIENSLLFDSTKQQITITITKTTKCYLYFDKTVYKSTKFTVKLINSGNLWQSGLEGDGYRFTGNGNATASTSPKNFICFGTTDKDTCTANPSTYMYRIIGVFADSNGNYHLKLIKFKQLSSTYVWHPSHSDVEWSSSNLYLGINGSYFLDNTTYSYMQDSTWVNKIESWKWNAVNTLTNVLGGTHYYYTNPKGIYQNEMLKNSNDNVSCSYSSDSDGTIARCAVGKWTTVTSKVGLMYVSDYTFSLGSTALSMTTGTYTNRAALKTGWLHQSNNDTIASSSEWTMARVGANSSNYNAWLLGSDGRVSNEYITNASAIRPVFYLKSDIVSGYGDGSLNNPYIISEEKGVDTYSSLSVSLSIRSSTLTANITKGTGNLSKYCVNKSPNISGCTWKNITGTIIKYTMYSYANYYVHVTDDAGYITHSMITYKKLPFATELIEKDVLWQSGLEDDGYRFIGIDAAGTSTNPNNFVCFGTANKSTCTSNPSTYMYRIIGVFTDSSGNYYVKLIKYYSLCCFHWHDYESATQVNWSDSSLFAFLNGSTYLTNKTYIPSGWESKIADWTWTVVNTLQNINGGPDYFTTTVRQIYLHELNKSGKTNTIGEWTTPTAKIGLMYVSDLFMSWGSSSLDIAPNSLPSGSQYYSTYGWMVLNNNSQSGDEWVMARVGPFDSEYGSPSMAYMLRTISPYPQFATPYTSSDNMYPSARPVFYLTSDIKSSSGTGTLSDPYMLDVS